MSFNRLCHEIAQNTQLIPKHDDICRRIFEELSEEEQELVAQSSYAYWNASQKGEIINRNEMRTWMALREIARYYDAAKEDRELTLMALKRTCKYRQQYRIDLLRSCFDDTMKYTSNEEESIANRYKALISADLEKQPVFVKAGSSGRGVVAIGERTSSDVDEEGYLLTTIYMIERAVAVTEHLSEGHEDKIDVVLDAGKLRSKNSPNRQTVKKLVDILQDQYPQRLNSLVVLDPPLWLSTIYSVVSSFVDQRTRNKFQMARGAKAKKSTLAGVYKFQENQEDDAVQIEITVPFQTTADLMSKSVLLLSQ